MLLTRRQFQFSSRAAIFTMSVIAIGIAWVSGSVRERRQALATLRADGALVVLSNTDESGSSPFAVLLRDTPVHLIFAPPCEDIARLERIFPEAEVVRIDEEVAHLISILENKKGQRRQLVRDMAIVAARQLGEFGPHAREALPALQTLSQDANPEARDAARRAILAITAKPSR